MLTTKFTKLAIVGVNESERHNIQTIYVTVTLYTDFDQCAQTDDITHTTNYSCVEHSLGIFHSEAPTEDRFPSQRPTEFQPTASLPNVHLLALC